ncbi:MAG: FMN-binding negative transcriptional regulator [Burkholderiaceae bacterium]
MYLPKHFAQTSPDALHELLSCHPLATWIVPGAAEVQVNHLPFILEQTVDGADRLIGHVARANPVWQALEAGVNTIAVFQGPNSYISPNWYPSKQLDQKVVPTWNYAVVHVHGTARAVHDKDWLLDLVTRLTDKFEASQDMPWQVADAPDQYINKMIGAIVGIELSISRMTGKWKNSQNRNAADRAGVAAGLGSSSRLVPPLD